MNTKEFARAVGVSDRTVENWRSKRDGRLMPAAYDDNGRAVYSDAQIAQAKGLLTPNQKKAAAPSIPLFDEPTQNAVDNSERNQLMNTNTQAPNSEVTAAAVSAIESNAFDLLPTVDELNDVDINETDAAQDTPNAADNFSATNSELVTVDAPDSADTPNLTPAQSKPTTAPAETADTSGQDTPRVAQHAPNSLSDLDDETVNASLVAQPKPDADTHAPDSADTPNATPAQVAQSSTALVLPPPADTNATELVEEPITLEERAARIRQYSADVQRGIIHIGLELIAAKKQIGHGNWGAWLEAEFSWTQQTANNYMRLAERFGTDKLKNVFQFQTATLIKLLALPKGDEQAFIDAQEQAGTPVEKQSAREVQKAVGEWKKAKTANPPTPKAPNQSAVDKPVKPSTTTDEPKVDNAGEPNLDFFGRGRIPNAEPSIQELRAAARDKLVELKDLDALIDAADATKLARLVDALAAVAVIAAQLHAKK